MKQYTSYTFKIGKGSVPYTTMSSDEFDKVKDALDFLQTMISEMEQYRILDASFEKLFRDLQRIAWGDRDKFVHLNLCYTNWLNVFYMWVGFHEFRFKDIFGRIKGKYYDGYIEYRTVYYLRSFACHKCPAITAVTYDCLTGKSAIVIKPKYLLDMDKKEIKTKDSLLLQSYKKDIDAIQLAKDTRPIMNAFQNELWDALHAETQKHYKLIMSYIPSEQPDCYNSYISNDDDSINVGTGHIITRFIELAEQLYPEFLK